MMWNALSASKMDIVPINAESKAKDGKGALKVRKFDDFGPKNESEADRSEFDIKTSRIGLWTLLSNRSNQIWFG